MLVPQILVFFVPFVAYSFGVALFRRVLLKTAVFSPHPVEAIAVLLSAFAFCSMRPAARVVANVTVLTVFAFAAGLASGRLFQLSGQHAGTREFEEEPVEHPISIWKRWVALAHAAADFQVRLILAACYVVLIGPIAMLFRLTHPSKGALSSTWMPRTNGDTTIGSAEKPF